MKFRVEKFQLEHGREIFKANERDGLIVICKGIDPESVMKVWHDNGDAYTLLLEDEPVVCAGIVDLGWRRGEAWTLVSSLFFKYRKTCFKAIKKAIEMVAKDMNLIRVQGLINENIAVRDSWMKHLGFTLETPNGMKNFGPNGECYYQYSRVFQ